MDYGLKSIDILYISNKGYKKSCKSKVNLISYLFQRLTLSNHRLIGMM